MTITETFTCTRCKKAVRVSVDLPESSILELGLRLKEINAATRDLHELAEHWSGLVTL